MRKLFRPREIRWDYPSYWSYMKVEWVFFVVYGPLELYCLYLYFTLDEADGWKWMLWVGPIVYVVAILLRTSTYYKIVRPHQRRTREFIEYLQKQAIQVGRLAEEPTTDPAHAVTLRHARDLTLQYIEQEMYRIGDLK